MVNEPNPQQQHPAPLRVTELKCSECHGTGTMSEGGLCDCRAGRARAGYFQRIQNVWEAARIPSRFKHLRITAEVYGEELARRLQSPYRRLHLYEESDAGFKEFWETEGADVWDGSWLLWGPYGVGKTGAAVGLAWEIFMGMYTDNIDGLDDDICYDGIRFISLPDLLSELRDSYNQRGKSEGQILKEYQTPALVILDDLGAEHVKDLDWLRDRLFQLIGHRHAENRQTIFTSNLSPSELGERLGERVMWRLIEMCSEERIVHMTGPNLRERR